MLIAVYGLCVALLLMTLSLYTSILTDSVFYLQNIRRTFHSWKTVDWPYIGVTIAIAIFILGLELRVVLPIASWSIDMVDFIISHVFYLGIGIVMRAHTRSLVSETHGWRMTSWIPTPKETDPHTEKLHPSVAYP